MQRAFSDTLSRIDMQPRAAVASTDRTDRRDVLYYADLIVDVHEGNQHRVRAQRGGNLGWIQQSFPIRNQVGNLPAAPLQLPAGIEHGLVLGARGHDVTAALAVILSDTKNRQVVCLGSTRSPDDFGRGGAPE